MDSQSMPCPTVPSNLFYAWLSSAYIACAIAFLVMKFMKSPSHYNKAAQFILLAIILIGPPLWFLFQFNQMYIPWVRINAPGSLGRPICESFKYNQDLASKVWAGVSALVLLAAFNKKDSSS
jgi:hypothetical protein